ncbi:MAG: translation elongation factor Ts, partial [Firmicutes bacterium HGW-Firmicutes-13]
MVKAAVVKELREKTGAGMMDCKKALVEAEGDLEKAVTILREKGLSAAAKKSGRITAEGLVDAYIHLGGKIGVLIEVNCETDFVAKNELFRQFSRDLCMQIAATNPQYISVEEVPEEVKEKEKQIYRTQALRDGKPEKIVD